MNLYGILKKHQVYQNNNILKKKIVPLMLGLIAVFSIVLTIYIHENNIQKDKLTYSQEYVVGMGNIKGNVDVKEFEEISHKFDIGANDYGYAVFKNPEAAFEELNNIYADGIALIQNEFNLEPLSQNNYELYGTYGWQVTTGSDDEKAQAYFVSGFMDIYENSFKIN